jgi:signal transduction histidine kinase
LGTEVEKGPTLAALPESLLDLDKLIPLLDYREPVGLASGVLSILLESLGAEVGSLFYATRPPLRVRRGNLAEDLSNHLDQWEDSVEARILSGAWRIELGKEPLLASRPTRDGERVLVYSLIVDGEVVAGTVCLVFRKQQAPGRDKCAKIEPFMQAAGSMLRLVGEHSLVKERLSQLTLFYQVAKSMASTFDLAKVLENIIQLATAVLDASVAALMLVDEENGDLVYEYVSGQVGNLLQKQRTGVDEGIAGWVVTHGQPVLTNDAPADPRFDPRVDNMTGFLTQSMVCAPLQIRGRTIGVIEVLNKRSGQSFDAEDLSLMVTTSNQAAIAIENARLYQSLRDERDRILQAQENVRRQVARNLHDGTIQFLAAITMGIDHLERLLELKPEAARSELGTLRDLARQATRQSRLALFELRPLILETQGLVPALEAYVQQLQGNEGFGVHLDASVSIPEIGNSVAATIFAIVQEAVNNTKKHASARDVWLRLSAEAGWLKIIVEDNGSGFDAEEVDRTYDQRGSIGLLSMRERAELIEGRLTIESDTSPPHTGTRVILQVPTSGTSR